MYLHRVFRAFASINWIVIPRKGAYDRASSAGRSAEHRRALRDHPDYSVDAAVETGPGFERTGPEILEAGACAPSGGNMQRYRFLVVRDPKVKPESTLSAFDARSQT